MVKRAISNIGKMMVQQQTEIMSVATMLMAIGIVTKAFGLLFNSIALGNLGAEAYNSFLFASNIPELISQVILLGGITSTVLPILAEVIEKKGESRFIRVFSTLVNISIILFTLVAGVIALTGDIILPWFITEVIQPKNEITPAQMIELVNMMRVMMIPQVILGISVYMTTVLNLHERFLVPQLAPFFYNIGRIIAIYILIPIVGQSPWVLVIGTIAGSVLHLIIQIPLLGHIGIEYKPIIDIGDNYLKKVGVVALPRLLSVSVEQIAVAIDKFIAFGLAGSSLGFYNLAVLVISVPLSLFGTSFSTASFPSLSKSFSKGDRIVAGQTFMKIMNQVLFLSIPAAIILLILRVPVTRLTFGIFGSEVGFTETYAIAWTILFFAPGIVFESLRPLIYRTFYATHDTVRPLIMSLVIMIGGVITGILFTNYLSHFNSFNFTQLEFNLNFFLTREAGLAAVGGLALSSSIMFTLEAILLIIWLNIQYLKIEWKELLYPIFKKLIAGTIMLIFLYLFFKIWGDLENTKRTLFLIILTGISMLTSFFVYIGASWVLKVEEVNLYTDFLKKYPNKEMFRYFTDFNFIPDSWVNP